jgi:hypothetical protein
MRKEYRRKTNSNRIPSPFFNNTSKPHQEGDFQAKSKGVEGFQRLGKRPRNLINQSLNLQAFFNQHGIL